MMYYNYLVAKARSPVASERGASLVEYALLVALIAVVCIGAVTFLGGQTAGSYSQIGNSLN